MRVGPSGRRVEVADYADAWTGKVCRLALVAISLHCMRLPGATSRPRTNTTSSSRLYALKASNKQAMVLISSSVCVRCFQQSVLSDTPSDTRSTGFNWSFKTDGKLQATTGYTLSQYSQFPGCVIVRMRRHKNLFMRRSDFRSVC